MAWIIASWLMVPFAWAQEAGMAAPMPLSWLSEAIHRFGFGLGLLAVFLGGLALNLTPCVYPMIPVTLAFFSNQVGGSIRRTLGLALLYVTGISLSYAALGFLAAKTGELFGSWLQSPVVLIWVAVAIVSLSLSMFGVYEIRLPRAIAERVGTASAGRWGAFLMGMLVGLVAAPCVGPFLVGLLLLVSETANPAASFLLFFVLGFGMGLPSLVLAVAAHRIGHLPKSGPWLVWSKRALGVVLLGVALYFIKPLVSASVFGWTVTGFLIGAGAYLGWLEPTRSRSGRLRWVRRILGSGLLVAALAGAWPRPQTGFSIPWTPYSAAAFTQAAAAGRPILIDVYADWCLPCVEMDHTTFRNPAVVDALASVTTLRVDATREVSKDAEALLEQHDVYGAPTILLFGRGGKERKDLRMLGYVSADELLQRLAAIQD